MSIALPFRRLRLANPHSAQVRVLKEARRFNAVACGRRWGKTTLGIQLLAEMAVAGYPVAWFAPTYKLLAEAWRELKDTLAPIVVDKSEQEHRLTVMDPTDWDRADGVIECWSLDTPDAARGRKYARVVIDEAAIVKDLANAWQAAIRPTLTDYRGDAWLLSTPKGLNHFWQLYQQGNDPMNADWASWQMPTSANPFIDAGEIENARRTMPERIYQQEYLAEFLSEGAGVFRKVTEAARLEPQPPKEGHHYVAGVDWGRVNDFTVISVVDIGTREQVYLDRFNQIDYVFQVGRLKAVCDRYRPLGILAEHNSIGNPLVTLLQRAELPVRAWTATNATKAAVIEGLSLSIEKGELALLKDAVQTGELLAFDAVRLPSGLIRYGAPEGMYDDTVIALALANALASKPTSERRVTDFAYQE